VVLVHHLSQGLGLFDRLEVLALEVFDQGDLVRVASGEHARDFFESGDLGGAQAAFAGHEVDGAVLAPPDDNGLEHAFVFDGLGELEEAFLVEVSPGLEGVGAYFGDGDFLEGAFLVVGEGLVLGCELV
jgi:hypothetical protein